MRYLKQNTATRVTVGPFLDVSDAKTPEVALTATNEHVTLIVDDGGVPTLVIDTTATASGGNNDLVHVTNDNAGFYDLELTAAQTNYVGRAVLGVNYVTDHLPVWHEFTILPANVYDSMMGTDKLDVNAAEWLGGTIATPTQTGVPEVDVTHWIGTAVSTPTTAGVPEVDVIMLNGVAASAANLEKSASVIQRGTVYNDGGTYAGSTTVFYSDDVTTATADHWIGRVVIFTSGTLAGQATSITDYALTAATYGTFTVDALTSAPANDVTFVVC